MEAVYREHVRFVWRTMGRMGIPSAEIEDAAHEVFVVVHRRLADYDGRAAMTSWLYGIARGVARNRIRALTREQRRLRLVPDPAPRRTPEVDLQRRAAAQAVARFLETLDADRRVVFELSEIEGMRATEIAKALGINVNTIYTRLRAARARFEAFVAELLQREEQP